MFGKRQTIFGCLLASLLFLALGVPSTAAAETLERAEVRTLFGGSVDQSERVSFTDEKTDLFGGAGLDGYIATNDDFGIFVLEGDESTVESAIDDLQSDSRLEEATVLERTNPSSESFSSMGSHTELDPRNDADATIYHSEVKKVRIRAEFVSGLSEADKLYWHDGRFSDFNSDGLGGLFVNGNGSQFMTIEIEGPESTVDYWINELQNDSYLAEATVVATEFNSETSMEELVSHTWKDNRGSE